MSGKIGKNVIICRERDNDDVREERRNPEVYEKIKTMTNIRKVTSEKTVL
jgi:hypothetical protein